VENSHEGLELAGVEPSLEPLDCLRRERNLGNEDDGTLALRESVSDGLEIDLGLARSGYAVEEEGAGE
jgi:hypothetical protein